MKKSIFGLVMFLIGIYSFMISADAKYYFEVIGQCETSPDATLKIKVDHETFDGFDIYRMGPNGEYQFVDYLGKTKKTDSVNNGYSYNSGFDYSKDDYDVAYTYENNKYVDYRVYTFVDKGLNVNNEYSYRVDGYKYDANNNKIIVASQNVTVMILQQGPVTISGKRNGKLGSKLSWSHCEGADGYRIYMVKDYDDVSNHLYVDIDDLSQYTLIKEIRGVNTHSINFSKLKNGVTYTYRVCAYKTVDGVKVESTYSPSASVIMNYYTYDGESYSQRIKRAFGSEKKKAKNFSSSSKASKQMKRIKIKVWDFKSGKKGKKVTKTKYITVNKKLAPSIQQMFNEIYKSKEKQVINDIGCYSYRTGEHMYGMAIDINPNENYMIDGKQIMSGSYWKPKKDPYSIPANCETVRIMKRYGFYRGEWGNRKDYMHFSYFGT